MYALVQFALIFCGLQVVHGDLLFCHDDPRMDPDEGTAEAMEFTWLGTLQYIHIKKGIPHYFRAPRVVLISPSYVLSTAIDASEVPDEFALGNVVFNEYERDEEECGITLQMLADGASCEGAALIVPIADVLVHPEYPKVPQSIALLTLLTPIRSSYMLPVCLPLKNFIIRKNKTMSQLIYHIDYSNAVPRDVLEENKEVLRLLVLPRELCRLYNTNEFHRGVNKNRIMCTTGCGLHSGAPSIVHEITGHWTVVALSQGWSPCTDPLRSDSTIPPPPQHTLLYPYVPWITEVIEGVSFRESMKNDPFGYAFPRTMGRERKFLKDYAKKITWSGHWWVAGLSCFLRGKDAEPIYKFYHEIFEINPGDYIEATTSLAYYLEIQTANKAKIVCLKVGFSYKAGNPVAWDIGTSLVKLRIPVIWFYNVYRFQVEAWAVNVSDSNFLKIYDELDDTGYNSTEDTDEDYFSWELTNKKAEQEG